MVRMMEPSDLKEPVAVGSSEAIREATVVAATPFAEFFQAEHVRLARAMYLVTGSAAEADELTQEAMVRIYERWDRVQRMDNPQGYLFRTALNLHRSRIRFLATRARHIVEPTPIARSRRGRARPRQPCQGAGGPPDRPA